LRPLLFFICNFTKAILIIHLNAILWNIKKP